MSIYLYRTNIYGVIINESQGFWTKWANVTRSTIHGYSRRTRRCALICIKIKPLRALKKRFTSYAHNWSRNSNDDTRDSFVSTSGLYGIQMQILASKNSFWKYRIGTSIGMTTGRSESAKCNIIRWNSWFAYCIPRRKSDGKKRQMSYFEYRVDLSVPILKIQFLSYSISAHSMVSVCALWRRLLTRACMHV